MAYDEALARRVRDHLAGHEGLGERRMMGGIAFMIGETMCCGVSQDRLLVRVGKEGCAAALARPHVRPMEMGGRRMGAFVFVEPEGYASDAAFAEWVGAGVAYAATIDGSGKGKRRRRG